MNIKLTKIQKTFLIKILNQKKVYVFTVQVTSMLESKLVKNINIKRCRWHKDDCKSLLTRKDDGKLRKFISEKMLQN